MLYLAAVMFFALDSTHQVTSAGLSDIKDLLVCQIE